MDGAASINVVCESRGQTVEKISSCWARIIFCSLNVLGDGIRCSSEFSEGPTQQQARRLTIHDVLWWLLWGLYQALQIQLAGFQERGSFSSWWCQSRRGKKIQNISTVAAKYWRKLELTKCSRQIELEFDKPQGYTLVFQWNIKIISRVTPHFYSCLQNKLSH